MTDVLRSYGIDAAGNAVPIADPSAVQHGEKVALAADSEMLGGKPASDYFLSEDAENLGGVTMELLWENASPTSSFAEQTVSLDLSTFEFLIIEYLAGTDWNARICYLANKGEKRLYAAINGSTEQRVRQTVISDTGLQFRGGEKFTYGNPSGTGLNTGMIPVKIYGIKEISE